MTRIKNILIFAAVFMLSACFDDEDSANVPNSISGTITPLQISAADSDVNDTGTASISNNTIDDPDAPNVPGAPDAPQFLPNPVILGGYLNLPNRGPTPVRDGTVVLGNSYSSGDVIDIYKVNLAAGDAITLTVAENRLTNDLRLLLIKGNISFNDTTQVINFVIPNGGNQSDRLVVGGNDITGNYFVAVVMCGSGNSGAVFNCGSLAANYRGYTNYTLRIGSPNASANSQSQFRGQINVNSDFVPGDIMIKFKQGVSALAATSPVQALSSHASTLGLTLKGGAIDRVALLNLGDSPAIRKQALSTLGYSDRNRNISKTKSERQRKLDTLLAIQALRGNPSVSYAEPNLIRRALRVPNDTFYGSQWHYPLINLPQAWDISTGAPKTGQKNVIVAVLDTGVLLNHPDFKSGSPSFVSQLVSGYDFISNAQNSGDGESDVADSDIDSNPDDPGDKQNPDGSSSFHGTHVAGTIAASTNNNSGTAGIAWDAKIMPVRVLGRLGGSSFDIIQGLRFAAGLSNDSGITLSDNEKADIINLSFGGEGSSAAEEDVHRLIQTQNVIVVAAAGNSGSQQLINDKTPPPALYPAAYETVISVSAVGYNGLIAPYSNFGSSIAIAAPGGDMSKDLDSDGLPDGVLSTYGIDRAGGGVDFGYNFYQGTSMAAPHVAGVLALMLAINPDLSPLDIDSKIANGEITDDIGDVGVDGFYGYGLINALKAVIAADNGTTAGTVLTSLPRVLSFGAINTVLNFSLYKIGVSDLTVSSVISDQSWLSITNSGTADGLGIYTARVNRNSQQFGNYQATITVTSDGNNITIPVTMQKLDPAAASNISVGTIYLLVIDPTKPRGESVVAATRPVLSNGHYRFNLGNIPNGQFLIYAGNDTDNDLLICGNLESCGAYGGSGRPTLLSFDGGAKSNLDFNVNFAENLITQSVGVDGGESSQPGFPRPNDNIRRLDSKNLK